MTSEMILEAIGMINDSAIKEAKEYRRQKSHNWVKWGAMAACLCVIAITLFAIPNIIEKPHINTTPNPAAVEHGPDAPADMGDWYYNGCLYVIGSENDKGNREVYGLPWPIEESSIGEQCGYAYRWDGYDVEYTKVPVYDYNPLGVEAVKISTDINGSYCYIIFLADSEGIENNEDVVLGEHILSYYGVSNSGDILSISIETGYTDNGVLSKTLTDSDTIKRFFDVVAPLNGKWCSVVNMPDGIDRYITLTLENGLNVMLFYTGDAGYLRVGNAGFELSDDVKQYFSQLCLFET